MQLSHARRLCLAIRTVHETLIERARTSPPFRDRTIFDGTAGGDPAPTRV